MSQGDDKSTNNQSSTQTTTNNVDKRVVLGNGSQNFNGEAGSTLTVNQLDAGAVSGAIDLSKSAINLSASSSDTAFKSLGAIIGLSKDLVNLEGQAATHIQDAYQNAADTTSGARQIAIVGLVIVGAVVAAVALRKG